jgi:integral membrane protein
MSANATDPLLALPPASGSARRLTPKKLYRIVAIAEAITWTLLISGLVIRATTDVALGVTIGGSVHGFVFLAYGATAILTAINQRWSVGLGVFAVVTAVIPYATIPFSAPASLRVTGGARPPMTHAISAGLTAWCAGC